MATRNRVFYQSEALFVAPSGVQSEKGGLPTVADQALQAAGKQFVTQIQRVQSINYSFEVARTDVNQFGQLAAIDRIIVEQPTVSLDFTYYPTTGSEESGMGFKLGTGISAVSSLIDGKRDVNSYFVFTSPEGKDANLDYSTIRTEDAGDDGFTGDTGGSASNPATTSAASDDEKGVVGVLGFGNAFMTSYSAEAAVGEFVSATVNCEALNMTFDSDTDSINNPTVSTTSGALVTHGDGDGGGLPGKSISLDGDNFQPTSGGVDQPVALRHGDISLHNPATTAGLITSWDDIVSGHQFNDMKVQNFSFSFDLAREDLQKIGSKFAFAKLIEFPATATLDVSAVVGVMTASDGKNDTTTAGWGGATEKNPIFGVHQYVTNDAEKASLAILCHKPNTTNIASNEADLASHALRANVAMYYAIHGAKLDSQSFSSSIGDSKTVDMSFSTQIGGPTDTANGIRIATSKGSTLPAGTALEYGDRMANGGKGLHLP